MGDWAEYIDEALALAVVAREAHVQQLLDIPYDAAAHTTRIEKGVLVGYRWQFLKSIGMSHTFMSAARGGWWG